VCACVCVCVHVSVFVTSIDVVFSFFPVSRLIENV